MRARFSLTLALAATLLAGCTPESSPPPTDEMADAGAHSAALPERDLTLQTPPAPAVEVTSAVELSRPAAESRREGRARVSPRPAPAAAPDPVPEVAPTLEAAFPLPAVAVAEVAAEPAADEAEAADASRELAPGRTVTVIPASSGPSVTLEEPDWGPVGRSIIGGGGSRPGTCRPRGGVRGIGIAGRIPVGVPGRRLR